MKRYAVLGVLVLALLASLLVGCAEKELTREELDRIVTNVLAANAEVDTCKFDMSMQETIKFDMDGIETIELIGEPRPEEITIVGGGTGSVDNAAKAMQLVLNMTVNVPGEGKQELPTEAYLVSGWMYTRVDIPGAGPYWMKLEMPDEMWGEQNQLDQNRQLLETAEEVNSLGSEEINGIDCYVVEVVPGAEALRTMFSQIEIPGIGGTDLAELNMADMVKEMSFTEWVAKDSYLFVKTEQHILMEIRPGDIGAGDEDFKKITANIDTGVVFYDYNVPVSIELPEEALEAAEIPWN
ncbi:MAG: DUF6612 family protein [Chloroflexota bacterium]